MNQLSVERRLIHSGEFIHRLCFGRAAIDGVLASQLVAPGMCNAQDDSPCIDGDPSAEAVHADMWSPGQRNLDALIAIGVAHGMTATEYRFRTLNRRSSDASSGLAPRDG